MTSHINIWIISILLSLVFLWRSRGLAKNLVSKTVLLYLQTNKWN
jgi:hypothetical protein